MLKGYKVVCVDDERDILEVYADTLESLGHEVVCFDNIKECEEYIFKHKREIAIIFSDFKFIPEKNTAFDLKKSLDQFCEIPFIVITGFFDKSLATEALDYSITNILEKPITGDNLTEYITKYAVPRIEEIEDEKEMVGGFLEESMPILEEIENLILELEEDPTNPEPLAVYFRLLHTIKGTASCVGLTKLGEFAHIYEDFIGELRTGNVKVNTSSINILLSGFDSLKNIFETCQKNFNDEFINLEVETAPFKGGVSETDAVEFENMDTALASVEEQKQSSEVIQQKEKKKEAEKLTVSMDLLNEFMEENGELTVVRNAIVKTVKKLESKLRGDDDFQILNDMLDGMYNITSNIQNKIVEMRKVPLKTVFRPFKRLVRDMSKSLEKEIEMKIVGEELYVDNVISKLYSNTLIHLIRNSLDHGIESKEERLKSGKPLCGTITISVEQKGEMIELRIQDDGKGIDPEVIKKKAIEKQLYSEDELSKMSKTDVLSIVFESGFSTATIVSDISGRGVGMDMVRGSFEELGGEIITHSDVGVGTIFNLNVPVPKSVLIINALQVSLKHETFLFSMDEVVEVLKYSQDNNNTQVDIVNGTKFLRHNNKFFQLLNLYEVLEKEQEQASELNIVIVRHQNKQVGIVVDEIFEFEEVVMRKINKDIACTGLYQGAALLGSGEVSLILSSEGMFDKMGVSFQTAKKTFVEQEEDVSFYTEYLQFSSMQNQVLCIELDEVLRLEKFSPKDFQVVGDNFTLKYQNSVLLMIDPFEVLGLEACSFDFDSDTTLDVIVVEQDGHYLGMMVNNIQDLFRSDEEPNTDTINIPGLEGSIFYADKTLCIVDTDFIFNKVIFNSHEEEAEVISFENMKSLKAA